MKRLATLLLLVAFSSVAGCLPTYLGDPDKSVVDDHLLGLWHLSGENQQLWFLHKLDAHRYAVQAYTFQSKDGRYNPA